MLKSKSAKFGFVNLLLLMLILMACGDSGPTQVLSLPTAAPTTQSANTVASATTQAAATTAAAQASTAVPTTEAAQTQATTAPSTTVSATSAPAATTGVATTQSGTVPRFEDANPCPYTLPKGQTLNQTVRCGYIIVPELHSQPNNGKTIKLGVVIFKSTASSPAPEPVIYLQGGPGGDIQSILDLMTGDFYKAFTSRDDAIFFDQRGVGQSQPALVCPEFEAQAIKDAPVILSPQESEQHNIDAAVACHDRLVNEGINLNAYNSIENAGDVNDIRQALGYKQIDLYGGSYGTLLGQTVMRLYPQILRSVILDSVVPPDVNLDIQSSASGTRSLNLIFQACAADAKCNRSYPDLKNVFSKIFAQLNANPPTVKVTLTNNKTFNAKVDGVSFRQALYLLLYDKQAITLLPQILYSINSGNQAILGPLMSVPFETYEGVALGMYYSVECSEEWPFSKLSDNQQAIKNAWPEFAQDSDVEVQGSITLCQKWNVQKAPPAQISLIKSAIPTLVMEGQIDPITPPENGQRVAKGLSNSFYVEFPASTHVEVQPGNTCAINVMTAFLTNPKAKPDSSCTASLKLNFP
ncbi:MAG TPA: alpha/beta fold hydrolase [Chloroflexia bacterium]|nr:alpha/beta fold hydrolase [Chloroflexia bacterium]